VELSGDAEVHDVGMALVEQDVLRLDVAVENPVPVRVGERGGHAPSQGDGLGRGEPGQPVQAGTERSLPDVGHHVERVAGRLARVEQREDVGVLELGDRGDLPEELGHPDAAHRFGADHLDRDGSTVAHVAAEVHGAHATGAQLGVDQVAVGDGPAEVGVGPGLDAGLDLEEVLQGAGQGLQHPGPGPGGGVRVLAVDDLGPVAAGDAELQGPVVLGEAAVGQELTETLLFEANAHGRVTSRAEEIGKLWGGMRGGEKGLGESVRGCSKRQIISSDSYRGFGATSVNYSPKRLNTH
jgi:hypothetical protein